MADDRLKSKRVDTTELYADGVYTLARSALHVEGRQQRGTLALKLRTRRPRVGFEAIEHFAQALAYVGFGAAHELGRRVRHRRQAVHALVELSDGSPELALRVPRFPQRQLRTPHHMGGYRVTVDLHPVGGVRHRLGDRAE